MQSQEPLSGNSPFVQLLGLGALTAQDSGSIPGPGRKIPQAAQHCQNQTNSNKDPLSSPTSNSWDVIDKHGQWSAKKWPVMSENLLQ